MRGDPARDRLLKRVQARGAVPLSRLGRDRPLADSLLLTGALGTHKDHAGNLYVYIPYIDPYHRKEED